MRGLLSLRVRLLLGLLLLLRYRLRVGPLDVLVECRDSLVVSASARLSEGARLDAAVRGKDADLSVLPLSVPFRVFVPTRNPPLIFRVTEPPLMLPLKGALLTDTVSSGAVPEMVSAVIVPCIPLPDEFGCQLMKATPEELLDR